MSIFDLSKKEKKIARQLIEKGLQIEFEQGIRKLKFIIDEWQKKGGGNQETYHSLYKTITVFDKHIGRRYDKITGSNYIYIIAGQVADDIIDVDDLSEFSDETRNAVLVLSGKAILMFNKNDDNTDAASERTMENGSDGKTATGEGE
jgi:hypothetical protein